MNFYNRLKNIIKSNINHKETPIDIDINSYDEILYSDKDDYSVVDDAEKNIEKEYYAILEVEYGADFDKIKKGYKKLLKKYHPDMFHNKPEKIKTAQKLTEKINEAYTYFEKKYN